MSSGWPSPSTVPSSPSLANSEYFTCSSPAMTTLSESLSHAVSATNTATTLSTRASSLRVSVHVEVEIYPQCRHSNAEIARVVRTLLTEKCPLFANGSLDSLLLSTVSLSSHTTTESVPLSSLVHSLTVVDMDDALHKKVSFWQADITLSLYRLSDVPPESDYLEGESELPVAEQWELPNALLQGLWGAIVLDNAVKRRLLRYCATSLHFAHCGVDNTVISWNKMLLLYGPPGTGKTSLCKALAHKIAISQLGREPLKVSTTQHTHTTETVTTQAKTLKRERFVAQSAAQKSNVWFTSALLFEVNCHSLFSKWFSESGKLVMRLFSHISEVAEDEECLVFLLIDEVESIASARSAASSSGEPGDAIRVVNAVLTSLDALKRKKNVLVMCTSNMISSLDEAFLDRLDLKIFLGNPDTAARYSILCSCLSELCAKDVISEDETFHAHSPAFLDTAALSLTELPQISTLSVKALKETYGNDLTRLSSQAAGATLPHELMSLVVLKTEKMSGRTLRKLPVRAHSLLSNLDRVTARDFILAMLTALESEEQQ